MQKIQGKSKYREISTQEKAGDRKTDKDEDARS
jgi:hypothetical protein